MTGDEPEEEYLDLNFNDPISSIYYMIDIVLKMGYYEFVENILILQKVIDPQPWKMLFVKLFGYSFLIIMEFAILEVMMVFIFTIVDLYE